MPIVEFDEQERQGSLYDYPKLKLKHNERARILVIEPKQVRAEFVHRLEEAVIVNGQVLLETVQTKSGEAQVPKMNFVGQSICLGTYDTLKDKGIDVANCPVCNATQTSDAVKAPQRRFAMHIVQYTVKPGSWDVAEPFSVGLLAWAFTQRTFDKIVDLMKEWGDLRHRDLLLGPCENEGFQKYDIQPAPNAAWLVSEERKQLVAEVYKNNQSPNIDVFIGRRQTRPELEADLSRVLMRNAQAFGGTVPKAAAVAAVAAGAAAPQASDVDALLGEQSSATEAPVTATVDDLLATTAPEAAPTPEGDTQSFEELLQQIDT